MAFPTHFPHLATLPVYRINPSFVDVFNKITPVQDSLLAHLDIEDVLRLRRVTKRLQDPFKIVQATQFNINARLKFYFDDPVAFRNQQAKSGAFITGCFADDLFMRTKKSMKEDKTILDLAIQQSSATQMIKYLKSVGYVFMSEETGDNPLGRDALKITHLVRTRGIEKPFRRVVRISQTRSMPLYACLRDLMVSSVSDFITWEKAYSIFPFANTIKRQAFILEHSHWQQPNIRSAVLQNCKERSFMMQSSHKAMSSPVVALDTNSVRRFVPPHLDTPASLGSCSRRVGDKHTWAIPLNTAGIQPPDDAAMQNFLIEAAEFTLELSPSARPFSALKLRCEILDSVSLRYQYIVRPLGTAQARYNDLSVMALEVLEPKDRPNNYNTFIGQDLEVHWDVLDGWDPPSSWVYYDDEVVDELKKKWPELQDPREYIVV